MIEALPTGKNSIDVKLSGMKDSAGQYITDANIVTSIKTLEGTVMAATTMSGGTNGNYTASLPTISLTPGTAYRVHVFSTNYDLEAETELNAAPRPLVA